MGVSLSASATMELALRTSATQKILNFQRKWRDRNKDRFGMALTSRKEAGQITEDSYNNARRIFREFGVDFYGAELARTQKHYQVPSRVPPSRQPALKHDIQVVEVGIGQKDFLQFPVMAWNAGFGYHLWDCDQEVVLESRAVLEEMITTNSVIAFDTAKVVKHGMLHQLVSGRSRHTLPNQFFGLGVFVRVLQHNKAWWQQILTGIRRKAMLDGRIIIAHPCRDDNKGIIYTDTEPYSRGEILDGFNFGFKRHQWWDVLYEKLCPFDVETYRWMVLGDPRQIGYAY